MSEGEKKSGREMLIEQLNTLPDTQLRSVLLRGAEKVSDEEAREMAERLKESFDRIDKIFVGSNEPR